MARVWMWTCLCLWVTQAELRKIRNNRAWPIDDLTVELVEPKGIILGHVLESHKGNDYYAYQEIPYAAPPIAENRFQVAQPHPGWSDVLNTTKNTKRCIQSAGPPQSYSDDSDIIETEDCLYLNVYSPVPPGEYDYLPVYIWIHGGGFLTGDGTYQSLNPSYFMDYDVIIVTMNYRLGVFGFLTTNDENLPGNLGLKDQQKVIKWVSDNIFLFGGSPRKITVGGGTGASYQLISQRNLGLLAGVIQQSDTAIGMTTWQPNYRNIAFQLGQKFNSSLTVNDLSYILRDILLNAAVDDLKRYASEITTGLTNGIMNDFHWAPIIEEWDKPDPNPNAFIDIPMLYCFITGLINRVPYIIGFNSEESLFFMNQIQDITERARQYDEDPSLLITEKISVHDREQAGQELKKVYTNSTFVEDVGAFVRFSTDANFARPSIKEAVLSFKQNVYLYQFAYSETPSTIPGTENVGHGEEIPYFWSEKEVNETIRTQLLTLWTNFMKYHNPTPRLDDVVTVTWPAVRDSDTINYLNINETLEIRVDPKNFNAVRSVLDKYMESPYIVY